MYDSFESTFDICLSIAYFELIYIKFFVKVLMDINYDALLGEYPNFYCRESEEKYARGCRSCPGIVQRVTAKTLLHPSSAMVIGQNLIHM